MGPSQDHATTGLTHIKHRTKEIMAQHASGIPISSLPKTIKDAIEVSRHLEVNLLWVDSLCIVQDDPQELDREIANMSAYYRNALITISAAVAGNCAEGFLGQGKHSNLAPVGFFELSLTDSVEAPQSRVRLSPFWDLSDDAIDTRAWTLQEGLMSTRLVSSAATASLGLASMPTTAKPRLLDSARFFGSPYLESCPSSENLHLFPPGFATSQQYAGWACTTSTHGTKLCANIANASSRKRRMDCLLYPVLHQISLRPCSVFGPEASIQRCQGMPSQNRVFPCISPDYGGPSVFLCSFSSDLAFPANVPTPLHPSMLQLHGLGRQYPPLSTETKALI